MSLSIQYDSSFDGFLSSVFEIYNQHLNVVDIIPVRFGNETMDIFLEPFKIETNNESANRIRRAIINKANVEVLNLLNAAFLSEQRGIEMKIFAFLRKFFAAKDSNYGLNPASEEMLPLFKIAQSVRRESEAMLGMVRFACGPDSVLYAEIEPKYDVLEMIKWHFCRRFSNEKWLIYDSKRKYGIYHEKKQVQLVYLPEFKTGSMNFKDSFTFMWKDFYDSISIKERENPKLLRRCLPVRYWKHLPERNYYPQKI